MREVFARRWRRMRDGRGRRVDGGFAGERFDGEIARARTRLGLGRRRARGSFERAFAARVSAREGDEGIENRDARAARVI
jgi:hypothetical protein